MSSFPAKFLVAKKSVCDVFVLICEACALKSLQMAKKVHVLEVFWEACNVEVAEAKFHYVLKDTAHPLAAGARH